MYPLPDVGTIGRMQSVAFAVPLLRGQTEATRIALAWCRAGGPEIASCGRSAV
jgi:hypothetical protein